MADGRRVVLGVTGGVAAYKAAYLARRLMERGYEVRVVMTDSAQEFIGPATFAAITGSDPVTSFFSETDVSPHTALGQWADVIVIAPATAGTISRLAYGQSSDVLIGTVLASTAPVVVAPAMHTEMWAQPAVEGNIGRLKSFGYTVIEPEIGVLAGGDEVSGWSSNQGQSSRAVDAVFPTPDMTGLRVLITAGGTREPIDPVRYLGNHSSGKMGNALAEAASERGASVVLVTAAGPPASNDIETVTVETAQEMATEVWKRAPNVDVAVMAAAVADFTPQSTQHEKIRRADGIPTIELKAAPDVLKGVHEANPRPFLVGFAAESGSVDAAIEKAADKGVDLLVANDVSKAGSGFGTDTNEVRLVFNDGSTQDLELMSKRAVAEAIWDTVMTLRAAS